jgi:hypothetical protein
MQTLSFSSTSPDITCMLLGPRPFYPQRCTDQPIDDIASSMWTIIEDNTAIICACLPMCKRALAIVFPCLAFERHHNLNNNDNNNKLSCGTGGSHTLGSQSRSRPRGRWTQFFDGSHKFFDVPAGKVLPSPLVLDPRQVSTHSRVYSGQGTPSEEFIMSPMSPAHDASTRAESLGSEGSGAIRKVTRYEVAYDNAPMPRIQ